MLAASRSSTSKEHWKEVELAALKTIVKKEIGEPAWKDLQVELEVTVAGIYDTLMGSDCLAGGEKLGCCVLHGENKTCDEHRAAAEALYKKHGGDVIEIIAAANTVRLSGGTCALSSPSVTPSILLFLFFFLSPYSEILSSLSSLFFFFFSSSCRFSARPPAKFSSLRFPLLFFFSNSSLFSDRLPAKLSSLSKPIHFPLLFFFFSFLTSLLFNFYTGLTNFIRIYHNVRGALAKSD